METIKVENVKKLLEKLYNRLTVAKENADKEYFKNSDFWRGREQAIDECINDIELLIVWR